jgi:pimeloyl-ACP methyl ester carboxylesterase
VPAAVVARWGVVTALGILAIACDGNTDASDPGGPDVATGAAFYEPPDPLPPGEPGELIRAAPITSAAGTQAWRVLYHSRAPDGRDIAVSGVVVAPRGDPPAGDRPVVSYAHGTTGLADACAPSRLDGADQVADILGLVDDGYVVAATDYEGLGTPGRHPYLVGESEGRSTLDAVRAAQAIPEAGAGDRVVVFGHSQGGHAALFAGEVAPEYAPELDLLGVGAGAPVPGVEPWFEALADEPAYGGFLVMGALGVEAAFPDAGARSLLTADADADADMVDAACGGEILGRYEGRIVAARDRDDTLGLDRALRATEPGHAPIVAPVVVWQGDEDAIVPQAVVDALVARACAAGSAVEYRITPGADHGEAWSENERFVTEWIRGRFAGAPARSTC